MYIVLIYGCWFIWNKYLHWVIKVDYCVIIKLFFQCGLISWKCKWINWGFECKHRIILHSNPLSIDLLILAWDYWYIQYILQFSWALISWHTSQLQLNGVILFVDLDQSEQLCTFDSLRPVWHLTCLDWI